MQEVNRRLHGPSYSTKHDINLEKPGRQQKPYLPTSRATAFSVAAYGCKSWSFSKKVKKKVETFEM